MCKRKNERNMFVKKNMKMKKSFNNENKKNLNEK